MNNNNYFEINEKEEYERNRYVIDGDIEDDNRFNIIEWYNGCTRIYTKIMTCLFLINITFIILFIIIFCMFFISNDYIIVRPEDPSIVSFIDLKQYPLTYAIEILFRIWGTLNALVVAFLCNGKLRLRVIFGRKWRKRLKKVDIKD